MKQIYFIGLFLTGLFVVGGCSEKRDSAPRVEIFPTVRTRVSGLYFDRGVSDRPDPGVGTLF